MSSISITEFSFASVIRGYHVYGNIWNPVVGDQLPCTRETSNRHDPFAVAVVKDDAVVGHVPRKLSAICSLFLRRSGSIMCPVTGSRQYSEDLLQGGLEIPCVLIFTGESDQINKVRKLVQKTVDNVDKVVIELEGEDKDPVSKKRKIDESTSACISQPWVSADNVVLTDTDKAVMLNNQELNDKHIYVSQRLLLKQFPSFQGLNCTLVYQTIGSWIDNYIQIMHCRTNQTIQPDYTVYLTVSLYIIQV